MVERPNSDLSLSLQAELLGLNRTSLYYQPVPPSAEEVALKHRIDEIYTAHPFYGSRRITVVLNQAGTQINRKAVQRHMREMCIAGICPGPNLSQRNVAHRIYPYLLGNLVSNGEKITLPKLGSDSGASNFLVYSSRIQGEASDDTTI
jgi:putative transposase